MRYVVHLAFTLFFLICTLEYSFGQGDLSATLKGQDQTTKLTVGTIELPNSLATKTGSISALIETGNTNILDNPNFEHTTATTSWTNNGTEVGVVETSVVISGKKSLFFNPSSETINLVQSSTAYQAQFADGVQCLAMVNVKSAASGVKVCSVQAGTVSTTNCVDVVANSKWGLYKVPFICGATSNGISISSTGSNITGAVYVDAAFVGAVDLKADVDQSRIAGESYFAATAGCAPGRASNTIGVLTDNANCVGPTIVRSTMGSWQTTDANNIIQAVNNLAAGQYIAEFEFGAYNSVSGVNTAFSITDGTTTCASTPGVSVASVVPHRISCSFSYATSGNRAFQLVAATSTGTITISGDDATNGKGNVKFRLTYFGSGSVYSSTNADTDWASCGHTTSDFTGFGTVTNIETQCKREGSDLLMRGKFTSGVSTNVEARINLKLGGTALTSASSSVIPSIQQIGFGSRGVASANSDKAYSVLIQPSVGYLNFAFSSYAFAQNPLVAQNGDVLIASGVALSFSARIPISGWTNSNIIIGSFNGLESCSSTLECTDTLVATVSTAGAISRTNVSGWVTSTAGSSGNYTLTFASGIFPTSIPNCRCNNNLGNTRGCAIAPVSTTSAVVTTFANGTTAANADFDVSCDRTGADYIGKTAKAVASDQNIATPGVTKERSCKFAWGGSGSLASPANCTASPCTTYLDTCGALSTTFSRSTTGDYSATSTGWAPSTPVSCFASTTAGDAAWPVMSFASDSSGNITVRARSGAVSAQQDRSVIMTCFGAKP